MQDKKQQKSKKYKYNKEKVLLLLLFFLLVGAKRREVEVWYPFCAMGQRSRLPSTFAGSCGRIRRGGSRRPRPSCRRGMRCSRGNGACRGGACPATLRLLACLPPCCVSSPTEAPSWLSWGLCWGLRLRQAARRRLAACALGGLARFDFGLSFANDLPDKILSVGKACRLGRLCLLQRETKLARGGGHRRLLCPGGDVPHLVISGVAGEEPLLVGTDRYLHQAVEELPHDVVGGLPPSWDNPVRVALRHHCADAIKLGVIAQRHDALWQPEPLRMVGVVLEQLLEHPVQLQNSEVKIEAWAQPHDIRRAPEQPGGPPPLLQRGDAAAKEVRANGPYSKPGKPEPQNPGGGDLQLSIVRRQGAPVAAAHYSGLAQIGEWLWICVNNLTPFSPPLVQLAAELPL